MTTATNHRTRRSAAWHARQIEGSRAQAQAYRDAAEAIGDLIPRATTEVARDVYYQEMGRFYAAAVEMDDDVEFRIEQAAADGWLPEDLEGSL